MKAVPFAYHAIGLGNFKYFIVSLVNNAMELISIIVLHATKVYDIDH